MKIKTFEDLECWQEARALTRVIYSYTNRPAFSRDFRLSGQISGASISIMNNISEGFDSGSNKEKIVGQDARPTIYVSPTRRASF